MAMLPEVFNAKDSEKMSGFEPLPKGWYLAEIVKTEMKDTKAGTGKYLTCQFKVLEPEEFAKRYVFNLMNLVNPNQVAVEIAQKELASLCEACGLDEIEDSTELHGIPIGIQLKIKPGDANYAAKNEIKQYCAESDIPSTEESPFD